MTTHHTYLLSNLSVNQFIEFQVAESDDVLAAARTRLQESGLSNDVQGGFFVSVYPTGAETIEEDLDQNPVAAPEVTPTDAPVRALQTTGYAPESVPQASGHAPDPAPSAEAGPLSAAVAAGPMTWPEDPQVDPPGAPQRSGQAGDEVPFVIAPLGGH